MAPNTLGPVTLIQDSPPIKNEIVSIKLPLDMSLGDTTNPSTWSGTQGQGLGHAHACIVMSVEESDDASRFRLEILVMRSFGTSNARSKVEESPFTQMLLPLPFAFGATPPPTPVGFGAPLACPRFQPLRETWVVARVMKIDVPATSKVSHTSLR